VPDAGLHGLRYDPDADQTVAVLYHAHYGSLTRIATLLVGDSLAAEDMVQDAFASVYRAWRHLRDGESALDYLRRAVVSRARFLAAASPGPPGTPLLAALRELPAHQREALVLTYYADWPEFQIAALMGISRRALNDHVRRGLCALAARAVAPRRDRPG
jgi:DNA-directed RNA polymerase specialized sigma24 family protein